MTYEENEVHGLVDAESIINKLQVAALDADAVWQFLYRVKKHVRRAQNEAFSAAFRQ